MHQYTITIKEQFIDSMGHVNNAAYLTLYEEARWELITSRGMGVKEIKALQVGPVVLDVYLKFKKEIRLRETITIHTQILEYTGKIGRMEQKMLKADGTVASEAVFTFGLFDLRQRKLIDPTPEWRHAIGLDEAP